MKKYIRAATAFEDEVMSNPTWQMVDRICKEHGYRFDPYARVQVRPGWQKSLRDIQVYTDNAYRPEIEIRFEADDIIFSFDIRGRGEQTRDGAEEYAQYIQDAIDLTYELEDINFWDLYEFEEEF